MADDGALPPPAENPLLLGHEGAERLVLNAWRSGRMPHAWLISGPRGVGKATLAYRIAKFVLSRGRPGGAESVGENAGDAEGGLFGAAASPCPHGSLAVKADDRDARLVASGGHPDLRILRREVTERGVLSAVIRVDDVRAFIERVRRTPTFGGWRVAIVDEAERLNRNAENALLKILEEPPDNTLILLVTSHLNALLPTTRSRCRKLGLSALGDGVVRDLLGRSGRVADQGDAEILVRLGEGSVGRALELAEADGPTLYREVGALLAEMPRIDGEALHALAGRLARRPKEGEADLFVTATDLVLSWVEHSIRAAAGVEGALEGAGSRDWAMTIGVEEAFRRRAGFARLVRLEAALNLDRKQVVIDGVLGLATGVGLDPLMAAE